MIGTLGAGNGYLNGNLSGYQFRQWSFVTCFDNAVLSPYQTQNLDRRHLDHSYSRILVSNFEIRFQLSFHLFILSFILPFFHSSIHCFIMASFIASFFHSFVHSISLSFILSFFHSSIHSFIHSNSFMLLK